MNVQYDSYKNAKHIQKMVRKEQTDKLKVQLPSQGFIVSFLLDHSLTTLNSLWSSAQSKVSKNIFNFTVRYPNNTLADQADRRRRKLSPSPDCSFCLLPESLLHIVAGCKSYLEDGRYTWRHNSALHFIASSLQCAKRSTLYADFPGFASPCPNMLLSVGADTLYIIEITAGFETNIDLNAGRKHIGYLQLTHHLSLISPSFINALLR